MTQESWWKRELKEVFSISFTFFILFILFMFLKKAMLGHYNIEFYAAGTALIGSLILGKVVLIFDKIPLTKKMDFLPNIYRVFFRSLVYLLGFVLFTLLEHWVKGLIDGDNFSQAWIHSFHHLEEKDFLTSLVVIFIAFLFFNAFWVIRMTYGPKELYKLFFSKKSNK